MKCCICKEEIEKQYTEKGEVLWDKGNNASPIEEGGRCCSDCNAKVVVPARMTEIKLSMAMKTKSSKSQAWKGSQIRNTFKNKTALRICEPLFHGPGSRKPGQQVAVPGLYMITEIKKVNYLFDMGLYKIILEGNKGRNNAEFY